MNFDAFIQDIALGIIPFLFAITVHEAAHGYVARHFGDMTAYAQGRITLNPMRHIDPMGTIFIPLLLLWMTSGKMAFGWAKPVPVNFAALRHPKKDMLWVALAGPAANFVMALFWGAMVKAALMYPDNYFAEPLIGMAVYGVKINVILMVLNLLPLPPLDGGRIVISLLPHKRAYQLAKVEPYGIVILVLLAVVPVAGKPILNWVLSPLVDAVIRLISIIF
jgi:Zn-dependent protease